MIFTTVLLKDRKKELKSQSALERFNKKKPFQEIMEDKEAGAVQ